GGDTVDTTTPGVYTVTYNVTDTAGNVASEVTRTITVADTTAPVADTATLSDVTAECEVTSLTAPTATDNCVGSVTGTHDASLPITTQGTTVVTWTYDDGNGNTSTQTQNVIIQSVTKADAGTNGTLTICEGTTVTETQLFAELGGTPDTGGTWSPALAGAGTYTYTVSATSSCTSEATSEVVVTEEAVPSIPSISVERATCSTPGRAIITNYDSSLTYVFNDSTLAVDENGVINGYNFGVTYTVSVSSSCGRGSSEDFVVNGRLSGEDCIDTDNDGIPDAMDVDDDNDGIPDVEEGDGLVDTDNDGIPDSLDLDSDNDGINDVIEGGDGDLDTNGDGVIDSNDSGYTDANGDGQADDSVDNNEEPDTDGDGIPDYQDLDSDDDGINDVVEGGNSDEDGDGQVDNPYEDTDGDGIADSVDGFDGHGDANSSDNNTDPTDPNSGGNGVVDDSGVDSDGDGIADSVDGLEGFGDAINEDTCVKVNNLMSPNGDSANSYLHIDCIENFPKNTLEIFNRWGNTVYRAKGYNNSSVVFRGISEGRANINVGDKLPVGTYFYILDLGNGSKVKKGWIYINR
ncbi:MAG: gliding motility-associated C-terminal domain-containing protein, partial [Tenacibaculum sp.]|uniref:T9SS type B sorting domain-containing protein n=1 Tax=Tenacibaculum sp. TaxID=1906242 RepID=UPI0017A230A8